MFYLHDRGCVMAYHLGGECFLEFFLPDAVIDNQIGFSADRLCELLYTRIRLGGARLEHAEIAYRRLCRCRYA